MVAHGTPAKNNRPAPRPLLVCASIYLSSELSQIMWLARVRSKLFCFPVAEKSLPCHVYRSGDSYNCFFFFLSSDRWVKIKLIIFDASGFSSTVYCRRRPQGACNGARDLMGIFRGTILALSLLRLAYTSKCIMP